MVNSRVLTCLCVLAATAVALASSAPQSQSVAITGVNVVNVLDGRILPNRTIAIRGTTIASVILDGPPPEGARVVDGRGKFAIPGLWDMHVHIEMTGAAWLPLYVANGVTGIRDMGSDLDFILKLRDGAATGEMVAPQIVAAGPILDDAPGEWPFRMRVTTSERGRSAVQLLKRRSVDLVKVHNYTPRDVFFAVVEEARRQNLPVAGHVPLTVSIQEGVDAGMRSIEHLSEDGRVWKACSGGSTYRPQACRAFFEMLARRGVWQTPTLRALEELTAIGTSASRISPDHLAYANSGFLAMHAANQRVFVTRPELVTILRSLAAVASDVTRDMAAAGVGILAGCDGLIAGFCVHDELAAMVAGGMTPLAALQTATVNPARYLGRASTQGTVAAGSPADVVLLDSNPVEDVGSVRRIHAVIRSGRVFDRRALDQLLAQARTAAQQ